MIQEILEDYKNSNAINDGIHLMLNPSENKHELIDMINEKRKTENCFMFFPHEWQGRSSQIISHIRSYDSKILRKIHARKCNVKQIDMKILRKFCDLYHIQGTNKLGFIGWGIFEAEELIGVLSFGRHHRQNQVLTEEKSVVLDRLCFKENVRIMGGASKLFSVAVKWAMEQHDVSKIISFSDNRWSLGGVYEKLNFKLDKELAPDYFYIEENNVLSYYSKQSQKKDNVNCPQNTEITEKQWAKCRGLIQVYDAGKKRWSYKVKLERHVLKPIKHRRQGYYKTKKAGILYYQSSYELKAMTLLDCIDEVVSYTNQNRFIENGNERYMDFLVIWKNGDRSIVEVKPKKMIKECQEQLKDNKQFANKQGWKFTVWTEKELGHDSEYSIKKWADQFISTLTGIDLVAERKRRGSEKQKRYYLSKMVNDKITVICECKDKIHHVLRSSYLKNIERNGKYICERLGGKIAGSRPKTHLIKENPYKELGQKQCAGECRLILPLENFGKDKDRLDGYRNTCKSCRNKQITNKKQNKLKNDSCNDLGLDI